jgi:hypothetical protein
VQIVELLDSDISKYPELGTQGKFKDYLEKMDPLLRNQLFTVILQSEAMQKAQPVRSANTNCVFIRSAAPADVSPLPL